MNRNKLAIVLCVLSACSFFTLLYFSLTIKIRGVTDIDEFAEIKHPHNSQVEYKNKNSNSRRFPEYEQSLNKINIYNKKRKKHNRDFEIPDNKSPRDDEQTLVKKKKSQRKPHDHSKQTSLDGTNVVIENDIIEKRNKYLIYQCDSMKLCGGWGDRQRSIISTFYLAVITNRTFGINVTSPCDLRELYVPNKVNWVIDPAKLKGLSSETVHGMDNHFSPKDFHRIHTADVIYLKTNRDMFYSIREDKIYSKLMPKWAKGKGRARAFSIGWNILMKYRSHVKKRINDFLKKIPKGDLVCAHIRLGRSRVTGVRDSKVFNKISDLPMVWRFLDRYSKNASKIFVAADSEEVRKMARNRYKDKELDTGGDVMHIDQQRHKKNACLGLEMAILDQAVLGKCKVLLLSNSNFSQRAAMLGGLYDNLYLWDKGKIIKYKLS